MYFNTRELSAISLSAALWAILNLTVTPIFWELTHLPILCDMIGVSLLSLTVWWTRKPGGATMMGVLATILNLMMRPGSIHFLGFTAASVVFDLLTYFIGYDRTLEQGLRGWAIIFTTSLLSTGIAGAIIGTFFMNGGVLSSTYGGWAVFTGIHMAGGAVGGIFGVIFIKALESRGVRWNK
jgi:hypothetical protein